jgi:hypothetical protein
MDDARTKADENEKAGFIFLLFFGIGTFQWVARDSKPFFLPAASRPALPFGAGSAAAIGNTIAHFSVLAKQCTKNFLAMSFSAMRRRPKI